MQMGRIFAAALSLLVAMIASAAADTYPSRPITIVVPFPAASSPTA
jgi:tripartite-type tricarboxylate transporter receptor subunit TctC